MHVSVSKSQAPYGALATFQYRSYSMRQLWFHATTCLIAVCLRRPFIPPLQVLNGGKGDVLARQQNSLVLAPDAGKPFSVSMALQDLQTPAGRVHLINAQRRGAVVSCTNRCALQRRRASRRIGTCPLYLLLQRGCS